jgi:hypothetical protein
MCQKIDAVDDLEAERVELVDIAFVRARDGDAAGPRRVDDVGEIAVARQQLVAVIDE